MFFDPHGLTDQELLDKTTEIHKRLAYAGRFSGDATLMNQLQSMAEACAFEARERAGQRMFDMLNKNQPESKELTGEGKVAAKRNSKAEEVSAKREGTFRVSRSSTPTKE